MRNPVFDQAPAGELDYIYRTTTAQELYFVESVRAISILPKEILSTFINHDQAGRETTPAFNQLGKGIRLG